MEINRNNYEEYFLLYADNELSATEKKVVEIFLQENPDLKEEFLMFQMTVNRPEKEIKLSDKSFLLKEPTAFINDQNCDEIFVAYFDNELSAEERKEVEEFAEKHPAHKASFGLFAKAKLEPDASIVFPHKKQLYRKPARVIPVYLWRSAAAAVVIGFGMWFAIGYFNKPSDQNPLASEIKSGNVQQAKAKDSVHHQPENSTKQSEITASAPKEEKDPVVKEDKKPVVEKTHAQYAVTKPEIKTNPATEEKNIAQVNTKQEVESNHLPEPVKVNPDNGNNANQVAVNNAVQKVAPVETSTQNPVAQRVSYIEPEENHNQNYVFYDVPAEEFKKTKVGGFLKKVKRIVERTNPISRLLKGDEEQVAAK